MNGNVFKYIKKYGNLTFEEKGINDIDILIFTQIPYLDLKNISLNNEKGIKLIELWNNNRDLNVKPTSYIHKWSFKLMESIYNQKRYKDLILKKYVYHLAEDTQFGAITIEVPNDYIYVCFEGTDHTLWGWKEDFKLTYIYPTESQKMATKYLNDIIKLFGRKVVVCGHSKGGNLALVGAMNLNILKKNKIKKIYSFDGPGLKDEEFKSINYKLIRNKLINIIPNLSLVGVLLNQENVKVIKSKGIGLFQHSPITWVIDEDKFKPASQDNLSIKFDTSINRWLSKHNYKEREEIIEGVFGIFANANIQNFSDIKLNKLEALSNIIKSSKDMSEETRSVIAASFKLLAADLKTEFMNKTKEKR